MTPGVGSAQRADSVFRDGPERWVAESPVIVAGPISDYSKEVLQWSGPGPDGVPLKWVIKGELQKPEVLKGRASGTRRFSRPEQVGFLPEGPAAPAWVLDYGDLGPSDRAILFLKQESSNSAEHILPSGTGERDALTLVRDIVGIQALPDVEGREAAWISYLRKAPTDEGRKAALRSLISQPAAWGKIGAPLEQLLQNERLGPGMRSFAFGAVAFGITHGAWQASEPQAVDLLSRVFETESNPRQALQYLLHLKLVLAYANEESSRAAREQLRRRILEALRVRAAAMPPDRQLEQQYEQLRAAYPGGL